jgi:HEXXH motif-containing protein
MTRTTRHELSSAALTEIAWGRIDRDAVATLFSAEHSRHQYLAAYALQQRDRHPPAVATALSLLDSAQRHDPATVLTVLRHGWFGNWVTRLLEKEPANGWPADDMNRLGVLAVVAALRTGMDAELTVHPVAGRLHLPGLGVLRSAADDDGLVLTVHDGTLGVRRDGGVVAFPADAAVDGWSPARRLTMDGLNLLIEDRDPYRDCFQMALRDPLPTGEFDRWRAVVAEAWRLLSRHVPEEAGRVGGGIWSLVPLAPTPHGAEASVSSSNALGAVATTRPTSGIDFAITLVHEWAHSVLNGVLGFVRLHDRSSTARHFAPWRPDRRPLLGLLHGTFAFLAVAEAWQALRVDQSGAERAEAEFALRRQQLDEVLSALPDAPDLTAQGRRFVAILRQRGAALFDVPVGRRAAEQAVAAVREQKALSIRRFGPLHAQ